MAPSGAPPGYEVVDLLSDSETADEGLTPDELDDFDERSAAELAQEYPEIFAPVADLREPHQRDDHETIDLIGIPDIDVPPSDPIEVDNDALQRDGHAPEWDAGIQVVTEAACLQMILSVLPDISVDHVLKLIQEKMTDARRTTTQCEILLTELLEGEPYPKESEAAKNKKRKREDEAEHGLDSYEKGERDPEIEGYEHNATELLKDEFPSVPVRHLTNVLKVQKTLYKAYGVIEKQVREYELVARTFTKIGKSRNKRGIEHQLIQRGSQLPKELYAAKKKNEVEAAKRRKAQEEALAEMANLQHAQVNKQMGECACCFEEVPLNRMISCNGDTVHFYCKDCPRQQIETQMGQSRCRPACFGVDDCNGTFSRRQLQEVLSDKTFERLEHMQQMEDIEAAGLEFLSECPFCDFKMECPPVEVDKEFRCQSTKCGKTSCRLCQKESHIPRSCEECKKDSQITMRHIVEEAMSEALIRHCNKCKHPFIKELGCNKMTCTHCKNVQCYVCSTNVTDYNHFGEAKGKCPLHENIEDRHEQEVKRAADEAMAKVRADNPSLADADLMIKVSDRVKQAEDARRGRAVADAQAFPYHMVGQELRRIPVVHPIHAAQPRIVPPPLPPFQAPAPQPRGFDALLNLLPGNPFRQEGGDGPQAHNLAQQAHHPAPFQAIPRGIDAFGDHRGVFGARLEDVHMHLRELDEGRRRREGAHQALEARLVALRAQVAAIQRDGPAPAARPNRRQRDARY